MTLRLLGHGIDALLTGERPDSARRRRQRYLDAIKATGEVPARWRVLNGERLQQNLRTVGRLEYTTNWRPHPDAPIPPPIKGYNA